MGDPIEAAEALIASGRAQEAARALRARLDAGRGGLLARLTLVKALLAAGDTQVALAEAREAVSLNPNVAVAVLALGEALLAADALPTAIAELQRALRLDPDLVRARELIALAWLKAGEADKALEQLQALDDPPAGMLAACEAIKRAPAPIPAMSAICSTNSLPITTLRMIGQLAYAAPQILLDLADMVMPGRERLVHPRSGLRHRPGGRRVQAAGVAAGWRRPVAGDDREGAGAKHLRPFGGGRPGSGTGRARLPPMT